MRARLLIGALLVALLATVACSPDPGDGPGQRSLSPVRERPAPPVDLNVVVVIVDDGSDIACREMGRFMPKTSRLLRDQGRCFENATVTSPACCPSRAVLQTSQMGHNNGVERQIDADRLRVPDTIQDDLTRAGYDTYGTGKFFNGVSSWDFESGRKPSGFQTSDFWEGSKYYGYELWDDELGDHQIPDDRVHATTRTGDFLRGFIRQQAESGRPFYAYAAFKAPHTDNAAPNRRLRMPIPTPKNAQRRVPAFDWNPEQDLRDKLSIYRGTLASRAYYQRLYTARTRAMYDIDDEMGKTFQTLRDEGLLDTTAVIFTSDNGYHLGENGWETKGDPYRAAMDVPLLAWLPSAFGKGVVDKRPVGLIDVAPTLYDLLDVRPEHRIDGDSLLNRRTRKGTYFEYRNEKSKVSLKAEGYYPGRVPTWAMYRMGKRSYIEYYTQQGKRIRREFYRDLAFEENLLWRGFRDRRPSRAVLTFFRKRLLQGRTCAGTSAGAARNPCP